MTRIDEALELARYFAIDTRRLEAWHKAASTVEGYSGNIELKGDDGSPRFAISCIYSYNKERPWSVMLLGSWAIPWPSSEAVKEKAEDRIKVDAQLVNQCLEAQQ